MEEMKHEEQEQDEPPVQALRVEDQQELGENIRPMAVDARDEVLVIAEVTGDNDLLNKFLPPPPKTKCSDELQKKITRFIELKEYKGRSYNAEVRGRKDYRNLDFLRQVVTYQGIDEFGTCFSKDIFDPHGYDRSDFYDEIEAELQREVERK